MPLTTVFVENPDGTRTVIGTVRSWNLHESRDYEPQVDHRGVVVELHPVPGSYRRELVLEGFQNKPVGE